MHDLRMPELLIILVIVVVSLSAGRLPEVSPAPVKDVREFRQTGSGNTEEVASADSEELGTDWTGGGCMVTGSICPTQPALPLAVDQDHPCTCWRREAGVAATNRRDHHVYENGAARGHGRSHAHHRTSNWLVRDSRRASWNRIGRAAFCARCCQLLRGRSGTLLRSLANVAQ